MTRPTIKKPLALLLMFTLLLTISGSKTLYGQTSAPKSNEDEVLDSLIDLDAKSLRNLKALEETGLDFETLRDLKTFEEYGVDYDTLQELRAHEEEVADRPESELLKLLRKGLHGIRRAEEIKKSASRVLPKSAVERASETAMENVGAELNRRFTPVEIKRTPEQIRERFKREQEKLIERLRKGAQQTGIDLTPAQLMNAIKKHIDRSPGIYGTTPLVNPTNLGQQPGPAGASQQPFPGPVQTSSADTGPGNVLSPESFKAGLVPDKIAFAYEAPKKQADEQTTTTGRRTNSSYSPDIYSPDSYYPPTSREERDRVFRQQLQERMARPNGRAAVIEALRVKNIIDPGWGLEDAVGDFHRLVEEDAQRKKWENEQIKIWRTIQKELTEEMSPARRWDVFKQFVDLQPSVYGPSVLISDLAPQTYVNDDPPPSPNRFKDWVEQQQPTTTVTTAPATTQTLHYTAAPEVAQPVAATTVAQTGGAVVAEPAVGTAAGVGVVVAPARPVVRPVARAATGVAATTAVAVRETVRPHPIVVAPVRRAAVVVAPVVRARRAVSIVRPRLIRPRRVVTRRGGFRD